ncbi:MAG: hypothetical protein PVI86_17800 [Phycisphaerae bacterium]
MAALHEEIDELTIARRIGIPHNEARRLYRLPTSTVASFDEFSRIIGDYYNHHHTTCECPGGRSSAGDARSRAKEILEREYRRRHGDLITAFNEAHEGTREGLGGVLNTIAENLKGEAVQRYLRDVFDRHITPNRWEDKVEIIRLVLQQYAPILSRSIRLDQPERYAANYIELIQGMVQGLQNASAAFRRM